MSNKRKGIEKENHVVKQLKLEGWGIVQRSRGSKSPIDIWCVDRKNKKIMLIQSKRTISEDINYIKPSLKKKLEKVNEDLNGMFLVEFRAI